MESTCYLLKDETGKEVGLFSGDTLFIGDVGRPDLAQKVKAELTQEMLAGYLFDSFRHVHLQSLHFFLLRRARHNTTYIE